MERIRKFGGHRYHLRNVYYGARQQKQLKKDIDWAKQHGIRYRTTTISAKEPTGERIKGKALWFRR